MTLYVRTIKGGATGETGGGRVPALLKRPFFVNRLKPMRKNWGYGEGVTSPTMFQFQLDFVTSGFQRPV